MPTTDRDELLRVLTPVLPAGDHPGDLAGRVADA